MRLRSLVLRGAANVPAMRRPHPALFVAAALLVAGCGGDGGADLIQSGPVTITGDALPPLEQAGPDDPGVGLPMPEVSGTSFDGSAVSIEDDGRAKVIFIVTHWCPACQAEIEQFQEYFTEIGVPDHLDIYVVSTSVDSTRTNYPPSEWLEDWPSPVLVDDEESSVARRFGLTAFPMLVVAGPDGLVAGRVVGAITTESFETIAEYYSSA